MPCGIQQYRYFLMTLKIKQRCSLFHAKKAIMGLTDGSVVKNLPASAGDTGLISGLGRSLMTRNNSLHHNY